jgi:hypothetical protein
MCDPVTIGALALTAVGTYGQHRAQNEREADMRRLQLDETERLDAHYATSKQLLDRNQETYERDNVDTNMAQASADRQAQYAAADRAAPRAVDSLPGAKSGNSVVADAFARALAGAQKQATQQGAARADLASFGDFMGDAAIDNNRRSLQIDQEGSFANDSANVLGLELQHVASRPRGWATAGNLMTALGSALAGAGGGFGKAGANQTVGHSLGGSMAAPATGSPVPLFGGLY